MGIGHVDHRIFGLTLRLIAQRKGDIDLILAAILGTKLVQLGVGQLDCRCRLRMSAYRYSKRQLNHHQSREQDFAHSATSNKSPASLLMTEMQIDSPAPVARKPA